MKIKVKSIVLDAFRWTGDEIQKEDPQWIVDALRNGEARFDNLGTKGIQLVVDGGSELNHIANRGDYVIKGVTGKIFTCTPEVFKERYDVVEDNKMIACKDCNHKFHEEFHWYNEEAGITACPECGQLNEKKHVQKNLCPASIELEKLAEPLVRYLRKNYHPHAKVIIDYDSAEVVEGAVGCPNILIDEID